MTRTALMLCLLLPAVAVAQAVDHFDEALARGKQANEAFERSHRFVTGWLKHADPETGLLPNNLRGRGLDQWNPWNCAADCYPFMVLTAAMTDRPLLEGRMMDILRTEQQLTNRVDRMPDAWSFSKDDFLVEEVDMGKILFGASEYMKDGLITITEWMGSSPWMDRMIGLGDDMWKHAEVHSPAGDVPSENEEINGEQMQVLPRMYWLTGDAKYLDYACRLADYHLLHGHHPTRDYDTLSLRDHGCEIISGLCEVYAAVRFVSPEKAEAYQAPLYEMLDRILEVGCNEYGLMYNGIDIKAGSPTDRGISDGWGYDYNGFYTVYMVDKDGPHGEHAARYREATRFALSNLNDHFRNSTAKNGADETADSVEGGIYLYNREPMESTAHWIDEEIKTMWAAQQPDGVVEGWYGDGNSARTSLFYALWKTQGCTIRPWRKDVVFGAVRDGDTLYVTLSAEQPWEGELIFDRPRHKEIMHLPVDYPRINHFPEWYTVEAGARYGVEIDGKASEHAGRELVSGLALKAGRTPVKVEVTRR